MTEAEWLAATDPGRMLEFVRARTHSRKLRQFAAACCRRVWIRLDDARSRAAVELAERATDEIVAESAIAAASKAAWAAVPSGWGPVASAAFCAAFDTLENDPFRAAVNASHHAAWAVPDSAASGGAAGSGRSAPRPRRQSVPPAARDCDGPACMAWRTYSAARSRHLLRPPRFEWVPMLADALEDAGCTDAEVLLGHLRGPGVPCAGVLGSGLDTREIVTSGGAMRRHKPLVRETVGLVVLVAVVTSCCAGADRARLTNRDASTCRIGSAHEETGSLLARAVGAG